MSWNQIKPSKEFRKAVSCALDNNDFSKLNSLIHNTDVIVLEQIKVREEKDTKQIIETKQLKKEADGVELVIHKGNEYILKIHELNELIPGELISEQINHTEVLLNDIFKCLKERPDQIPKTQKLMNHYLPMTIKLLQGYLKFNEVRNPGAEVIAAKGEIEKTMGVVNEALTELLNQLFQVDVIDITTDAQVLKTVLAKDGLTKNEFEQ